MGYYKIPIKLLVTATLTLEGGGRHNSYQSGVIVTISWFNNVEKCSEVNKRYKNGLKHWLAAIYWHIINPAYLAIFLHGFTSDWVRQLSLSTAAVVMCRCWVMVFERPEVIDKTGWCTHRHPTSHDTGMIDTANVACTVEIWHACSTTAAFETTSLWQINIIL